MRKIQRIFLCLLIGLVTFSCDFNKTLDNYVNPFIGTDFHGHTYPGATSPFGMVQLSPDTRLTGWDGCSGYHYSDSIIYGFSHTHLSGTGISDYADILFMPTTGEPILNQKVGDNGNTQISYASKFSHNNEKATAGYYAVKLDDYNIDVELTATERVGFHKYKFPEKKGNVIVDLTHRDDVLDSYIKIVSDNEIEGFRRSKSWASDQYIYFVAKFSESFSNYGISANGVVNTSIDNFRGNDIKAYFSFEKIKKPLTVSVALSAVSTENARENMVFENNFDEALKYTQGLWQKELSKINVKSLSKDDKVVFYTALYHSMIAPNLFSDVNGDYRGVDKKIYNTNDNTNYNNFDYYTVFSLWDTYRATHPLLALIDKDRTNNFIRTFLEQYKQSGQLPVWELAGNETYCMIGYHSVPVIFDAYSKGIKDYDLKLALEAMVKTADKDHLGLKFYKKHGFVPANDEGESVSKTLEYGYDDWCISQMALDIGEMDVFETFNKRAQSYKNIFDDNTGFFRAKVNNLWFSPFDPIEVNFNYTEANAWQYNFYVPQDINSHIKMIGGDNDYEEKLDDFFNTPFEVKGRKQADITGLIGQYSHGNEPSHHVAYLYNYIGKPYKTQEYVRQIMSDFYFNAPDGLCGNDDCGQMSSWYVFSALGFYPVCPGDGKFIIGSPKVTYAEINTYNGNTFTIKTKNQSNKNVYIKKIILNGEEYNKSYITYDDIMNGGELEFVMARTKNKHFGKDEDSRPINIIAEENIVPVPYFENVKNTFTNKLSVKLNSPNKNNSIYYTIDGKEPTTNSNLYRNAIRISASTTIKAIAVNQEGKTSNIISTQFVKIPEGRKIQLFSTYPDQYSAGGDDALINGIRGGNSFKTGHWQGYQGQDLNVIVDLGSVQKINSIDIGFIQDSESWIFFPYEVEFYTSKDGKTFTKVGSEENPYPVEFDEVKIKDFGCICPQKTRYIKIIGKTIMDCPKGHRGEGHKSWLFADEIIIK